MPLYVPILKGKEGEFSALAELPSIVKSSITPLIEVPGVPFNYVTGSKAKSLDEHTKSLPEKIKKSWGSSEFYLDTPFFGEQECLADKRCAFEFLLASCSERGMHPVPVITPRSSAACLETVRNRGSVVEEACLRLSLNDFAEEVDTDDIVGALLGAIGRRSAEKLDLIIDFGELRTEPAVSILLARSVLASVPHAHEWRTVILAATSFPQDLSGVDRSSVSLLPRHERHLWKALRRKRLPVFRDLTFGDYAISHPSPRELDPRTMRMSANIRYTVPDAWMIVKGKNVNDYGFEQFFDMCKSLVQRPEYSGSSFSWGDRFIHDCAEEIQGPGNATTWRKVGVNHHISLIVGELSNPSGL